jgi:hypothetical protein
MLAIASAHVHILLLIKLIHLVFHLHSSLHFYFHVLAGQGGVGYNCELASHHLWQFISQRDSVWGNLMDMALRDYYATGTYVTKQQLHAQQQATAADSAADDATADAAGVAVSLSPANPANPASRKSSVWSSRLQWSQRYRLRQALLRFLLMAESGSEAGSANAAWMLLRGEGAGGPDAVDLAAELLLRCDEQGNMLGVCCCELLKSVC